MHIIKENLTAFSWYPSNAQLMKIVCIPVEWFTNGTLGLSISIFETVDCTRLLFSVLEAFLVSSLTLIGCIGRIRSTFNMQSKK